MNNAVVKTYPPNGFVPHKPAMNPFFSLKKHVSSGMDSAITGFN
jgi:hypothetical protein